MAGGTGGYSGGSGGTGYNGQDGADGSRGARNGGGGGGGAGGGMGGAGSSGAAGGAGGTAASPDGKPGTYGHDGGTSGTSGGGGGGGYNGNGSGSALGDNAGPLTGGYGGYGGRGGYGSGHSGSASGGGGAGGYGAVATDASGTVVTNRFAISGGDGGASPVSYGSGDGGDGGVGVFFVNTGVTLDNSAEIEGGAGGGAGRGAGGGAGGAGIVGSGLTINNSNVILGGYTPAGGHGGTGVLGSNISIRNSGTIEGGGGFGGAGVIDMGGGTIHNSGTIEMGAAFATRPARVAIEGTDLTIVNTGMIGRRDDEGGLRSKDYGITGARLTIKNVGGTIRGGNGVGRLGSAGISGSDLKIVNTGTIEGGFNPGTDEREADAIDFTGGRNRLTLGGTFGGALSVVGELKLLTDGAAMLAVAIKGTGDVEIAGDVTLSHVSSYTGATTIDAEDTLTLAARVSIASSAIADNGTLRLSGNTLQGSVTGSGFVKGAGTLTGDGTGGALRVAANGGTFTFTGAGDTFAGNLGGSGTIDFAGGNDTLEAGLALNVATLDLSGAKVSLAANQRFSHKLDASGGTLDLGGYKLISTHATRLAGISIEGAGSLFLRRRTNVTADTSLTARLVDLGATTQTADLTFTDRGYLTVGHNATDILAGDVGVSSARSILNAGTIEKTAGDGTSTLAGAVENSGTISVGSGTLAITGAVSGTGLLEMEGRSTMELGSLIAAGQSVDFGVGNSRLQLNDAVAFAATISGFGSGDAITLGKFNRMSQVLYEAARGGGGTLSVSDGARMFSTHLEGTYNASGFGLTHTAAGETIHYKG